MSLEVRAIYQWPFSQGAKVGDWEFFKSKDAHVKVWKVYLPDLEMTVNPDSCKQKACKAAVLAAKVIFFPWGICSRIKFCINRTILRKIYPAQCYFNKNILGNLRQQILDEQDAKRRIVRHLRLKRDGINYSALLIGSEQTISNGQWALHANGNKSAIERECTKELSFVDVYLKEGFNVLLVNGPGVGLSDDMHSVQQLGDAQELGLHVLESAVKAQRIAIVGVSIGAGAQSLTIDRHTFLQDRQYLVLRFATFDRLSNVLRMKAGKCGRFVLSCLKHEIDSVPSSLKLERLKIPEVIYQSENDRLMKNATTDAELGTALRKLGPFQYKAFKIIPGAGHDHQSHAEVAAELQLWKEFLEMSEKVSSV